MMDKGYITFNMSKHRPNRLDKWYGGDFTPQNPDKYVGDVSDIVFRSKWEYKFCYYCDIEERIKQWSSEHIKIPYDAMVKGEYISKTYAPDFWIQVENTKGELEEYLIEVKPEKQTKEPEEPKKQTLKSIQNYEYRLREYVQNLNKWEAAVKYCEKRGMTFYLLTEKYFEDKQIKLF